MLHRYHSISDGPSLHLAVFLPHLLDVWEDNDWPHEQGKSQAKLANFNWSSQTQSQSWLPRRVALGYLVCLHTVPLLIVCL